MGRKARMKKERKQAIEAGEFPQAAAPVKAASGAQAAGDKPISVGDRNFERQVIDSELPVLVDFWAPWCGPCKMIAPAIEDIAKDFAGQIKVVKYNTQDHQQVAQRMHIRSIPTLVMFKDGKVADVKIGASSPSALRSWVERTVNPKKPLLKRLFGGGEDAVAS